MLLRIGLWAVLIAGCAGGDPGPGDTPVGSEPPSAQPGTDIDPTAQGGGGATDGASESSREDAPPTGEAPPTDDTDGDASSTSQAGSSDNADTTGDAGSQGTADASPTGSADAPPTDATGDAPSTDPTADAPSTDVAETPDTPSTDAAGDAPSTDATEPSAAAADGTADPPADEPEPAPSGPVTYTLARSRSDVWVLVRYDRSALVAGHDHVLVASRFTGTVVYDPKDPSTCRIQVTVPAKALVVDPPGSRGRAGLEGETSDGDKRKILSNALGKSQLHADAHPNLTFKSTSCAPKGDRVAVSGTLTLRGQSKPVQVTMRITADDASFKAVGDLSFTHGDFGFKPFTAALGALRNDDGLRLHLNFGGAAK